MFVRLRRRWRRGPWLAVAAVAAIALVIAAQAYSRADVDLPASARVVAGEEAETNSLLAVATFPPAVPEPEPMALSMGAEGEEDGAAVSLAAFVAPEPLPLEPLACGTITNNTGHRIEELAAYGDDDAWGRVSVADEWLEPGDSTDLLCDIDGLPPGYYHWQGEVVASWAEGTARVRFEVGFDVPGALPADGTEPAEGEAVGEPGDEPAGDPEVPTEPGEPTEPSEPPAEAPPEEDKPPQGSPSDPAGGPGGGTGEEEPAAGPVPGEDPGDPGPGEDPGPGPDEGAGDGGGDGTGHADGDGNQEDPGGADAP